MANARGSAGSESSRGTAASEIVSLRRRSSRIQGELQVSEVDRCVKGLRQDFAQFSNSKLSAIKRRVAEQNFAEKLRDYVDVIDVAVMQPPETFTEVFNQERLGLFDASFAGNRYGAYR